MDYSAERWSFQEGRLDNGLRVLTLEDHRVPIASVQIWYHVGSKDEDPNRQGFAHMFEHMMFRGTDRIGPQDHFRYLDRCGARVNGYTSFDQTVYYETLPASQLDLALWLEAERLARLKINDDYFAAEREVVKEERRMRYLNRPYGRLYETLFAAAFEVHPYRWTPIGNMPHLDAATVDELRAFFETYYVPNNATLVVTGAVEHEQVMAKALKYFGSIPRRPDPDPVTTTVPPLAEPKRVEITDRAPSPRVVMACHAPSARAEDAIPLSILRRALSLGQSSRLYRRLVQGRELVVHVFAFDYVLEQAGLFVISATLKPDVTVEAVEQALVEELSQIAEHGIEPDELTKAKNQALAEYVRQGETVQGRADLLGYSAVVLDDPDRVNTDLERLHAVTAEDVIDVARRVFTPSNRVTIVIRPDPSPPPEEESRDQSSAGEQVIDLPRPADMPPFVSPRPVDLPQPYIHKMANGLRVVVFSDPAARSVSASYNALIGSRNDPAELAGLAYVTAGTMRRSTRKRSADDLAELIDSHGMSLSESVHHEHTNVAMWSLTEHLDLAVNTLAEVVQEPAFPENEVTGFASRASSREAINEEDPGTIASRRLMQTIFGDHYLGRPAGGTAASLKTIEREDAAAFHPRCFVPDGASLVFAGGVAPERAAALAEACFGGWQGQKPAQSAAPVPEPRELNIVVVDRPGAIQSEIRLGQIVPLTRSDPDYAAARLLSQVFGESFDGRLNRVLRIEKGLTYGASGYFDVDADAAALRLSTFTRTDKTGDAIEAALRELERLRTEPVRQEELDKARDTLIGRFQMALETPAQIARQWWYLTVWGLPPDWHTGYLGAVAATTDPAALTRTAERLIDPARLTIVVAGNAAEIEGSLRGIAPVDVVTGPAEPES